MTSLKRQLSAGATLLLGGLITWYSLALGRVSAMFNDMYQALWHLERHGITSIAHDGTLSIASAAVEGATTLVLVSCLLRHPRHVALAALAWLASVLLVMAALMLGEVTPSGRIEVSTAAVALLGVGLLVYRHSRRLA